MDFKRFRDIIQRNKKIEEEVRTSLYDFSSRVHWSGKVQKLMKPIGEDLNILIFELPMRDSDFGACFFKTPYNQYLLLNSNQPRCKINFAFCHDIYHVLHGAPEHINEARKVHLNSDYLTDEKESKANLFAANLLMPEVEFKKMFKEFSVKYQKPEEQVVLLMDYFESPFAAVLLRLYELQIWDDPKIAGELLERNGDTIKELFQDLWLSLEILKPTLEDNFDRLMNLLETEGDKLIQEELMSEFNRATIMENIRKLYQTIRLTDD